ncbi:MAG: hypothetical protein F6K42_02495 [Leptolyngbya sp. SIO1D8]|nr:hypothetical protein [Leptolyngbya sp. SIO1D8]
MDQICEWLITLRGVKVAVIEIVGFPMELPLLLTCSGLIGLDGCDLSLKANEHLFQWPGNLVYGELTAFVGSSPETIPSESWEYRRLQNPDGTERASRRAKPPQHVPDISIQALRDRVENQSGPTSIPKQDIARPNQAAAFEQRLNQQNVYNPFLDEYPMKTLALDVPTEGSNFEPEHFEGAQWAADYFSEELLGVAIMPPEVIRALGAYASGAVLSHYLWASNDMNRFTVEGLATKFADVLDRIKDLAQSKSASIEAEISLWASYGRSPVEHPNGSPDFLLSAADAATATLGIYKLCELACYLQDWYRGAMGTYAGIQNSF